MKNLLLVLVPWFVHLGSIQIKEKPLVEAARFAEVFIPGDSSIKVIDNFSQINSIKQLLEIFRGRPVYIDMWATWCEPCLEEFKYSDSLYSFLKKKQIAMIYLSIDKEDLDEQWRGMIKSNHLSGNHIRANKHLRDDLSILIWGAPDVFSIPHYLFFDKEGKLLDKNPPGPATDSTFHKYFEHKPYT